MALSAYAEAVAIFGCLGRDRVTSGDVQAGKGVENFGRRGQVRVVDPHRNEASILLGNRVEVCARFASPGGDLIVTTLIKLIPSQAFENEIRGENVPLVAKASAAVCDVLRNRLDVFRKNARRSGAWCLQRPPSNVSKKTEYSSNLNRM